MNTTLLKSLEDAEKLKKTPIPAGFVRFERNDYHYSRNGAITRIGHVTKDLPDYEAINWITYGCSSVTWPDGDSESFDMRVSPVEHGYFHLGYGELTTQRGERLTGTLSRLPNVFVTYYGARLITAEERKTFKKIILDY